MKIKFFITILFISLLFPIQPASAQDQNVFPSYVIQSGDSLGYIANLFNTTVEDIILLNNISNPDFISPGDRIFIPGYPGYAGELRIIATDLGETYSSLPVKYQTDKTSIIKLNSLLSPARIFAGSELIVLIPPDSQLLVPNSIMKEGQTGLELAASLSANPFVLQLQNDYTGSSSILSGTVVFSSIEENGDGLELFAPSLDDVSIFPLPLVQGGTETISVTTSKNVKLNGFLGDHPLQFFSSEPGNYFALQGVYALEEPGLIDFYLSVTHEDGTIETFTQPVLVTPGFFDEDPPLKVDPATIDPSITGPENELVSSIITNITPVKYWQSIFASPAYYQEYNSLFGTRRKYNDDPTVYFHTGVDFAGGMTLPITSPAPGKVVFSGPLAVRGNAVFIDHGWVVFSVFFHQDTLLVKVGDFVDIGQQIGTVGNTGRVNGAGDYQGAGAHLHWEVWVNGVLVNPLDWLSFEYP